MCGGQSPSARSVVEALARPVGLFLLSLLFFGWTQAAGAGEIVVATYEGIINPVAAEYLHDAIASAEATEATALIVTLDTPGGLDTSMRLIVKHFIASTVPIVVFVAPSGGRAASAGVFLTMAAHVAAMAPGTNIGAAHPVAMGGGEMDATMKEKVENDAVAYIKSLAQQHGRNVAWAEDAVRKSVSVTEQEAMKLQLIDIVADDVPTLIAQLHGRKVTLASGSSTLKTKGAAVRPFQMGLRLEMLKALSDPNIAYLLMTIGTVGILAELYNPGAILPGIVGAISLILAFYSLQSLPINYAGVLLLVLGIVFFVLEASVASYGLLALGGIASMLFGSLMLIKSDAEFFQLSWAVIIPVMVTTSAVSLFLVGMGVRAMRRVPETGSEGMVGLVGIAKTPLSPRGQLAIQGELWDAVSDPPAEAGTSARVLRVEGLTLYVTPMTHMKEV
ncbi:MAG: nodulation protein NfeD [Nitrospiraceae bacterium]|nr:nodulation protein NfeD [Nitrospiraceae bacterium]